MKHKTTCRWVLTTNVECEYRQTEHRCPHPEHACDCQTAALTGAEAADRATRYAGQLQGMTTEQIAITELCEAIRLTVQHVGIDVLPPVAGWAWFDALRKHDPAAATQFVIAYRLRGDCPHCKHRAHGQQPCPAPIIAQPSLDGSLADTDIVDFCGCAAR